MTEDLGPLPEYAPEFPPHFGDDGGFTGAQMRAYAAAAVAAERERCANLCEQTGAYTDELEMALMCADAIRRA